MTPETPRGMDALRNLAFSEIAVPQHRAIEHLTLSSIAAVRSNYWRLRMGDVAFDLRNAEHNTVMQRAERLLIDDDLGLRPGGMVIEDTDEGLAKLNDLYKGRKKFEEIVTEPFRELASSYYSRLSFEPLPFIPQRDSARIDGRTFIGYALDYGCLVEEAAGRENVLTVIAESIHKTLEPRVAGVLFDSAHIREAIPSALPEDDDGIYAEELRDYTDKIAQLRKRYLDKLDDKQKKLFHLGERNNINHLFRIEGYSPN